MTAGNDPLVQYRSLFRFAFAAAVAMLAIIPAQIAVYSIFPMPASPEAWLELFARRPLVGLFHADIFILVNNVLIAVIYLAFYHALKETNRGMLQAALLLGFIGIAAYISSNRTFELWALAGKWSGADQAGRATLVAAAQAMIVGWQGTAFDAYYVLNGVTLFIVAILMFRSPRFGKATAGFGLAAAVLMIVPSTAGAVGLVFSLLSLAPWYVFTIRFAAVFAKLGKGDDGSRIVASV